MSRCLSISQLIRIIHMTVSVETQMFVTGQFSNDDTITTTTTTHLTIAT